MQRLPSRRFLQRRVETNLLPNNGLYRRNQRVMRLHKDYNSFTGNPSNYISNGPLNIRNSYLNSVPKHSNKNRVYGELLGGFKTTNQQSEMVNKVAEAKIFPKTKPRLEINLKLNGPDSTDTIRRRNINIQANNIDSLKISHAIRGSSISFDKKAPRTGIKSARKPYLSNIAIRNLYHPKNYQENQKLKSRSFIRDTRINDVSAPRNPLPIFKASTFNPKAWIMADTDTQTTHLPAVQNLVSEESTSAPFTHTVPEVHTLPSVKPTTPVSSQTTVETSIPNEPVRELKLLSTTIIPIPSTVTEELDLPDGPDVPDLPEVNETTTSEDMLD